MPPSQAGRRRFDPGRPLQKFFNKFSLLARIGENGVGCAVTLSPTYHLKAADKGTLEGTALRSKGGAQGRPAAATQPLHSASPTPPPATPAGLGSTPPAGTGANIYTWLPFSQAGLTAAANVARQFAADYSTYTYTESAATFVRRMRGLITAQLAGTLAQAYSTPGVAQERTQQKQVYSGTGQITSIRGFGSGAITFVVAVAQKITETRGTSRNTINYAVTVTGAGTSWQVNDVELASAGNT